MIAKRVNFGPAFSRAFTIFGKNPWLAIGIYLLYMAMAFVGGAIPFVNFLFSILILFPLLGGWVIFVLNFVKE
jgi:hypothetical protein